MDDDSTSATPLRFLADECTFTQTVQMMQEMACTVIRIQDLDMIGASDPDVFQTALELEAVLVTTDRGFGDIRTYPPSSHHGIIVLNVSPNPTQIRDVHDTMRALLNTESSFKQTLFTVDGQKYRKRMRP